MSSRILGSQLVEWPGVRPERPRLGFRPDGTPGARTISRVRELCRADETFRGYFLPALALAEERMGQGKLDEPLLAASCWVATGEERFAEAAIDLLLSGEITATPTASYYSNVWEYSLAYDWLFGHPLMTEERRWRIEERIGNVLAAEFDEIDGNYPCVWHGRTQLANNILVSALSLSLHPRREEFQQRALAHFAEALRALALPQGWPEGPGYWIHNRAFPFVLGADCALTATGQDTVGGISIRETIRQTALWQLYMLQPSGKFVRLGDTWEVGLPTGPGLWQPVQDYYARITGDPGVVAAADHFRTLCGTHYHPGRYGWSAVLAYEPDLPMPTDYDRERPARFLNSHLPRSRVFGREHLGEAYFVERWGDPEAMWMSFKAGDVLAHHADYDQGSFTIARGSPLAVHSGTDGDYFGDYRLGYFIQTVSKNSLLIHAPGEFGNWARDAEHFDEITGGQRVVMPTGCRIHSVNDWLRQLGHGHYQAGDILAFASIPDTFDYVAADISAAYNSTSYAEAGNIAKVSSVVRKLAYLRRPGAVVIFDRVETTDPAFTTRWLLHTPGRPESDGERQIEGESRDAGIFVTDARWLTMAFEKGKLFHQAMLPESAEIRKIGGPHYLGYVERAGRGENLVMATTRPEAPPAEYGVWRTEVTDTGGGTQHLFLNALWPRLALEPTPAPARALDCDLPAIAVAIEDSVVIVSLSGRLSGPISYEAPEGVSEHLAADLTPRSSWRIESGGNSWIGFASEDGVLSFSGGSGPIRLAPASPRGGDGHQ